MVGPYHGSNALNAGYPYAEVRVMSETLGAYRCLPSACWHHPGMCRRALGHSHGLANPLSLIFLALYSRNVDNIIPLESRGFPIISIGAPISAAPQTAPKQKKIVKKTKPQPSIYYRHPKNCWNPLEEAQQQSKNRISQKGKSKKMHTA
jgi:hypothetical protein